MREFHDTIVIGGDRDPQLPLAHWPRSGRPQVRQPREQALRGPAITQPTITIASDFDGPNAAGTGYRGKFTGKYSHQILAGIGHDVPQEAPQAFADAIIEVAGY